MSYFTIFFIELQSIKAAEQLFFKDKTHYVDFQPVFISANRKDKIEGIVRHQSNKSSNNVHGTIWILIILLIIMSHLKFKHIFTKRLYTNFYAISIELLT